MVDPIPEVGGTRARLRLFLCHSSGDKPAVRALYLRLRSDGFEPWLDEENLLGGQDWETEIRAAVRRADLVLVCISNSSINRRGFVHKEIRFALDVADEQPDGNVFLIPLRLEVCDVPERLRKWQWIDLFRDDGYGRLLRALREPPAGPMPAASAPPWDTLSSAKRSGSELLLDGCHTAAEVIVLTRQGMDRQKRVWGPVAVDDVDLPSLPGPSGAAGWRDRRGVEVGFPYLIAEEALLSPALFEIGLTDKAMCRGLSNFTLPLTPAFFQYVRYRKLAAETDMLEMRETPDAVVATLHLPLKGGGTLDVEKIYSKELNIAWQQGPTPAFAVWPNFVAPGWARNYAASAAVGEALTFAAPILTDGAVLWPSPDRAKESTAKSYPPTYLKGQSESTIWPLEQAAVGFVLYARPERPGKREAAVCAGVLLRCDLPTPPPINANIEWRVAVDFGTSSTNFWIEPSAGGGRVPLGNRLVILSKAEASMKEAVVSNLYPEKFPEPPIETVLAARSATIVGACAPLSEYSPRFLFYPESAETYLPVRWERCGGTDDAPLRVYLGSLTQLIACEARAAGAGRVIFKWAFPGTMSTERKGGFEQVWFGAARGLALDSEMAVIAEKGTTKSEALCRYFVARRPQLLAVLSDGLVVAATVGRESTDVGVWSEGSVVEEFSLNLGANDVLPSLWPLAGFIELLYTICTGTPWEARWAHRFDDLRSTFVNAVLNEPQDPKGDPRKHRVVTAICQMGASRSPWVEARSLIYLFFCGLSFCVGLHARRVRARANVIQVHFGGFGASLLPWVSPDPQKFLEYSVREGFLKDNSEFRAVSVKATGAAISFQGALPAEEEVVRGLLSPPLGTRRKAPGAPAEDFPDKNGRVIPCEVGWGSKWGDAVPWDRALSASDLWDLTPPPNFESSYIAHLLALVIPEHMIELSLDPKLKAWDLSDSFAVRAQHNLRRGADDPSHSGPDPVFVSELRTAMDHYVALVTAKQAGELSAT